MIHVLTWDEHLLEAPAAWLDKHLPLWIRKPLYYCNICMSSFWGSLYFTIYSQEYLFLPWLQFILAVGGVNVIIGYTVLIKRYR